MLAAFTYSHDKVGNRLTRTSLDRHEHGTRYEYDYDAVYQLLEALPVKLEGRDKPQPNKAEVFEYDTVGNRLLGPDPIDTYTHNQANQLLEGPEFSYTYDKNGNLTGKTGFNDEGQYVSWSYAYDYENRLIRATKTEAEETTEVSFKYDPFGRRIEKQVEDLETGDSRTYNYVYDNEDIILETLTQSEARKERTETTRYLHGPGIDEPLAIEQKGDLYFFHADGLGSITILTDSKGRVIQSYEYSSYGIPKHQGNHVKQPYTYTGREWNRETGLYFYRARYYDPEVGRFISEDPIGFEGGINWYRYVHGNPINKSDPLGLYDDADFFYEGFLGEHSSEYYQYEQEVKNDILKVSENFGKCTIKCVLQYVSGEVEEELALAVLNEAAKYSKVMSGVSKAAKGVSKVMKYPSVAGLIVCTLGCPSCEEK